MPNDTPAAQYAAREREEMLTGPMNFIPDPTIGFAPKWSIYIFNVGPITHSVEKGSGGPRGGFKIPACEKGRPFSEPLVLPSVVVDTYMIENEIKTHAVSGEFVAQDIVHPMLGNNWSVGQNLDDLGVFWTKNSSPTDEELMKARRKLDVTFRKLLNEATQLEATGRLQDIVPLMRLAAEHYGEDRPWNKIYKKMAECPSCGAPAKEGIVIHSCGAVMPGMWALAVARGLKTRAQAKEAMEAEAALRGEDVTVNETADGMAYEAGMVAGTDAPLPAPAKVAKPRKPAKRKA